ncbi:chloroplastic [Seminavis robusta]|uniref:Chloroplastic n=1 Tax=Seminavis robusta TaxID=568900 RepID=A0A9N8DER9_9STRA|nr:chloroplastic [Seminavis robusta]|eukprot:Sro60_g034620.1 chloroplastic (414) ;mRNA; f:49391-50782
MKLLVATSLFIASFPGSVAFTARTSKIRQNASPKVVASPDTEAKDSSSKPIYDPLGLYPETSEEKQQGRIHPLEPKLDGRKSVTDPMGLYPKDSPEFFQGWLEERTASMAERTIYDPMGLYPATSEERQQGLIQRMEPPEEIIKTVQDPMGLYPSDSKDFMESVELEKESLVVQNRELYDPLGLYPESSTEYQEGKIKTLESAGQVNKPVVDPLNLYASQAPEQVDRDVVMSEALPFLEKPSLLNGELVGDAGFDPLGFAKSKEGLLSLRKAELKHARIAMLAAAGWPLLELLDKKLAALLHLKPLLLEGDRVPSLLNGGLQHVNPFYWLAVLGLAGFAEALDLMKQGENVTNGIFDPLRLYPKDAEEQERMQLSELKNGRLAMVAITLFAIMEAVTSQGVVNLAPFLFHPPF